MDDYIIGVYFGEFLRVGVGVGEEEVERKMWRLFKLKQFILLVFPTFWRGNPSHACSHQRNEGRDQN